MLDATIRKSLISFTTLSLCLIKLNDKDVYLFLISVCIYSFSLQVVSIVMPFFLSDEGRTWWWFTRVFSCQATLGIHYVGIYKYGLSITYVMKRGRKEERKQGYSDPFLGLHALGVKITAV